MKLVDKAVEVARDEKVFREMEGNFEFEGIHYDLFIQEKGARMSVHVHESRTGNFVTSFMLSDSSYTGT